MTKKLSISQSTNGIEIEQPRESKRKTYGVDIVFSLDVKTIAASETGFANQLLLVVKNVEPRVVASEIAVQSLIDLGVIKFSTEDPDFDDDVVCFEQNERDYWADTQQIQRVWDVLVRELRPFEAVWLQTPHVFAKRRLRYAIVGMKYFNRFRAPGIAKMPFIHLSQETDGEAEDPQNTPKPLVLFKE